MKITREVKVGLLTVGAIFLLIWGYSFLKGADIFKKYTIFYAVFDRVEGLQKSDHVFVNGLKVGQVSDMSFLPGTRKVVVELTIHTRFDFPKDSKAIIYGKDLLGSKAMTILPGVLPQMAMDGDTLQSELADDIMTEVNKQLEPVKVRTIALMKSIDSVLMVLQEVLNKEARDNLSNSFENIRVSLGHVSNATSNIDTLVEVQKNRISRILENVESVSNNLKNNNKSLTNTLVNIEKVSDTIAKSDIGRLIRNLNQTAATLNEITGKINTGKGTAGQMVNNDSLYFRMEATLTSLDLLLNDLRKNPKKYINVSVF